jgi:hypothetical protein
MRLTIALTFALALSACGSPKDEDILTDEKIEASRSAPEMPEIALSDDPDPEPTPAQPKPDTFGDQLNELGLDEANELGPEGEPPPAPGNELVPAAFHGRWAMAVEDCADPRRPGSSALAIGRDWIELPDGQGRLFRTLGNFPERFVGIFNYNGDRGRWSATEELALTASSNALIRQVDGGMLRYRRCTRTGG